MTPRTRTGRVLHENDPSLGPAVHAIEDEILDKVAAAVEELSQHYGPDSPSLSFAVLAAIERIRRDDDGRS